MSIAVATSPTPSVPRRFSHDCHPIGLTRCPSDIAFCFKGPQYFLVTYEGPDEPAGFGIQDSVGSYHRVLKDTLKTVFYCIENAP